MPLCGTMATTDLNCGNGRFATSEPPTGLQAAESAPRGNREDKRHFAGFYHESGLLLGWRGDLREGKVAEGRLFLAGGHSIAERIPVVAPTAGDARRAE